MADESIRSLIAELGFEVDTTQADLFNKKFRDLTVNVNQFAGNYERGLSRIKKSNSGFVTTAGDVANGIKTIGRAASNVFRGFAGVEQARGALEFRAKTANKDFQEILSSVEKIRKETGGVVSELDSLNALNVGADLTGNFDFLIDNFSDVIKLAKILGKDVGDVQRTFAEFVATGSNLQELVKFGFFRREQLEALEKAGTSLTPLGQRTRVTVLEGLVERRRPDIEEGFSKFLTKSNATIDRFTASAEEATKVIGEKLNPAINKAAETLSKSTDNFTKEFKKTGDFLKSLEEGSETELGKSIFRGLQNAKDFLSFGDSSGGSTSNISNVRTVNNRQQNIGGNTNQNVVNQTNNITIQGNNGGADETAKSVRDELGKQIRAAQVNEIRRSAPNTLNSQVKVTPSN